MSIIGKIATRAVVVAVSAAAIYVVSRVVFSQDTTAAPEKKSNPWPNYLVALTTAFAMANDNKLQYSDSVKTNIDSVHKTYVNWLSGYASCTEEAMKELIVDTMNAFLSESEKLEETFDNEDKALLKTIRNNVR